MKLVPAKCPNCGANIEVDDSQEKTKCEYCGDDILIDRAIQKYQIEIKVSNIPDLDNYLKLGDRYFREGNYTTSKEMYWNALQLDPDNIFVSVRLEFCKLFLSKYNTIYVKSISNLIQNNIELLADDKEKQKQILEDSFYVLKRFENLIQEYYHDNKNNFRKTDAIHNNTLSVDCLKTLELLLNNSQRIGGNEFLETNIVNDIISFFFFVIMPKKYILYYNKNGNIARFSKKLNKQDKEYVYNLLNKAIDKYNAKNINKIKNKKKPFIQIDYYFVKYAIIIVVFIILLIIIALRINDNKEVYTEYEGILDCTANENIDLSSIPIYNSGAIKEYFGTIKNVEGRITEISLDGDHPYFKINYNSIYLYINKNELSKLESYKKGDQIKFCGIFKESKKTIIKMENVTIIQ